MPENHSDPVRRTLKRGLDRPLTSDQKFNRVVFNRVYLGVYMPLFNRVDFPRCFHPIKTWHVPHILTFKSALKEGRGKDRREPNER